MENKKNRNQKESNMEQNFLDGAPHAMDFGEWGTSFDDERKHGRHRAIRQGELRALGIFVFFALIALAMSLI